MAALEIRCSSLPRVSRCPASAQPCEIAVESGDPSGPLGTAVHAWLAHRISGKSWDEPDGSDEYQMLCWRAWECWVGNEKKEPKIVGISDYFPNPVMIDEKDELSLENVTFGVKLTGHPDLLSVFPSDGINPGEVRGVDWKTGVVSSDYSAQAKGYSWLAMNRYPGTWLARWALVSVRTQTVEWFTWTYQQLTDWWHGLLESLQNTDRYVPGVEQCRYCRLGPTCPGKRQLVQESIGHLINRPEDGLTKGAKAGLLYDRIRLIESACEQGRKALALLVDEAGGTLPFGDGRGLVREERETTEIRFSPAWRIIGELVHAERYSDVFSVRKTELEKVVRDAAPRGQKGAAVKELHARLEQADAIQKTTSERLECRRLIETNHE